MVDYEIHDDVAVIRINRPEVRNAIDNETAGQLGEAWERFQDSQQKVGILTGEGDESFSAGADLEKMDLEDREEGYLGFTRMMVDKPTIASIDGYCVAGGLEMALWCDFRVASIGAEFGCYERKYGVPLVDGGTQRLPRIVGQGRALDMIITGRSVDAQTALEWGLVNYLTDGDSIDRSLEIAKKIAEFPQKTMNMDRKAVYEGIGDSLSEGLQRERELGNQAMDVAVEGAQRFQDE